VYEGDLHFLTRLAQRYGAFMTVKNGTLLFMPLGAAKSFQGEAFPETHLMHIDCMSYRYHIAERERYAGVRAYWYKSSQTSNGKRASIVIGQENGRGFKVLPGHYSGEAEARAAAQSEWQRIQRSQATLHLALAARPELFPEKIITCSGFASDIADTRWSIAQATHTLESSGFTTLLDLDVHDDPATARHRKQFRQRTLSNFCIPYSGSPPALE
jgi:phage protein D